MEIREKDNKISIEFNFLEKILSLNMRKKVFYFKSKKEIPLDSKRKKEIYFKYYIRWPGTCIPFLVKIGTFYKVKNTKLFVLAIILFIVGVLLALNKTLISILVIILAILLVKLSLGQKAFYCLKKSHKKAIIYELIPEKSDNYKELIIGK